MSRVGKKLITVPAGVKVEVDGSHVSVTGPKGSVSGPVVRLTSVAVSDGIVTVERASEARDARANHGLMRALLQNMVTGVHTGFTKVLEINGIGYRAERQGADLVLHLGYSHPIKFPVPADVSVDVAKDNSITVSGIDKQRVGQVAAVIRGFRKPDHYKGKGVRYRGETVLLKAGKSA